MNDNVAIGMNVTYVEVGDRLAWVDRASYHLGDLIRRDGGAHQAIQHSAERRDEHPKEQRDNKAPDGQRRLALGACDNTREEAE